MTIEGFIEPHKLELIVYNKLKDLGITESDYPINPYDIIENEGILLQEIPLSNINIRGMLVNGPNLAGIMVNSNRSFVSRRFIAMHELMHYWFHPCKTKTVCFEEYIQERKGFEWQANNAAAYALMPTELLIDLYYYFNGSIDSICKKLKVSKDSLIYRLNEIGLVPKKIIKEPNIDYHFINLENQWLYGGI